MALSHKSYTGVKYEFLIRLSYILPIHCRKITNKKLGELCNVSSSVISRLRNGHSGCSLQAMLRVADGIGLEYEITISRTKKGISHSCQIQSALEYSRPKKLNRVIEQLRAF